MWLLYLLKDVRHFMFLFPKTKPRYNGVGYFVVFCFFFIPTENVALKLLT